MKHKEYLAALDGWTPTTFMRWVIRKNERPTAREEAIAAEVIKQANPRENITGHFPWGPEEQLVLQQLWTHSEEDPKWVDVPIAGASELFTVDEETGIPIPNAVREPEVVEMDLESKLEELLGDDG